MKLRGKLRFEFDVFLLKNQESLKGSRDNKINKIQKKRKTSNLIVLATQVITEIAQASVIAIGAAIVIDYLKNGSIGNYWIIAGMVMIGLILVKAFKIKSS